MYLNCNLSANVYTHFYLNALSYCLFQFKTEPVAEWYERWRCNHSEAVWVGSKPSACKELLVLGKKLARTGASGIREVRKIPHRLAPGKFATFLACVSRRHEVKTERFNKVLGWRRSGSSMSWVPMRPGADRYRPMLSP